GPRLLGREAVLPAEGQTLLISSPGRIVVLLRQRVCSQIVERYPRAGIVGSQLPPDRHALGVQGTRRSVLPLCPCHVPQVVERESDAAQVSQPPAQFQARLQERFGRLVLS